MRYDLYAKHFFSTSSLPYCNQAHLLENVQIAARQWLLLCCTSTNIQIPPFNFLTFPNLTLSLSLSLSNHNASKLSTVLHWCISALSLIEIVNNNCCTAALSGPMLYFETLHEPFMPVTYSSYSLIPSTAAWKPGMERISLLCRLPGCHVSVTYQKRGKMFKLLWWRIAESQRWISLFSSQYQRIR